MEVVLSQHGEELLRGALALNPGSSPAEVVERALAVQVEGIERRRPGQGKLSSAEFQTWLEGFTAYSDRISVHPGETFSRRTIYGDHD